MIRTAAAFGAALLFTLGLGCGQKKINECNALIQVINSNVQALEKAPKSDAEGNGPAALKNIADAMDKIDADASKVDLTIPELKKFATDYRGLVKEVGKAAREIAAATEARDVAKISAAQKQMEKAVEQENPIIDGINKFCQAP